MIETWHQLVARHAAERKQSLQACMDRGLNAKQAAYERDLGYRAFCHLCENLGVEFKAGKRMEARK